MRPFYYLPIVAMVTACEPNTEVSPAQVSWMEWPAEVSAATPFLVRLLVPRPGCYQNVFKLGISADESAVTFTPYFLITSHEIICVPEAGQLDVYPQLAIDTVGTAPGLAASFARTFEMRAAAQVYAPPAPGVADLPVRMYGEVTVRLTGPDTSRRNGAGIVSKVIDNSGCVRLQPYGTWGPGLGLVLEDQADTSSFSYAFVRGYIYEAPTPVCGETRVFHLVSRN